MTRMRPQLSLSAFLDASRDTLEHAVQDGSATEFVTGNESADLDSMTSAVTYAYLSYALSDSPPEKQNPVIPLVNIPKQDVALRPEFETVLSKAGVTTTQLVVLEDLLDGSKARLDPENSRWMLVDHNKLTGRLAESFSSRVTGCIDHHDDEEAVSRDASPRIIRKCGSCTSLVVEHFSDHLERVRNAGVEATARIAAVAKVALASILIDTRNLADEAKVEPVDQNAIRTLEAIINHDDPSFDRTSFFREIDKSKQNLDKLSLEEVLRKDYKAWYERLNIGFSSSVLDVNALLNKASGEIHDFHESLKRFAEDRSLDVSVIMTAFSADGVFSRELLVCAWNDRAVATVQKFETECEEELGLQKWKGKAAIGHSDEDYLVKVWDQTATQHSRKRVAPLLRRVAGHG